MRISRLVLADDPERRFAPDAFESQRGQTIPVKVGDWATTAILVDAEVSDDGQRVSLTLDIDDPDHKLGLLVNTAHRLNPFRPEDWPR